MARRINDDEAGESVSDVKWRDLVMERMEAQVVEHGDVGEAARRVAADLKKLGDQSRFFDEFAVEALRHTWHLRANRNREANQARPGRQKLDPSHMKEDDESIFESWYRIAPGNWIRLGDALRDDLHVIARDYQRLADANQKYAIKFRSLAEHVKEGKSVAQSLTPSEVRAILAQ